MARRLPALALAAALGAGVAGAQDGSPFVPEFSIWDVALGQPMAELPEGKVAELACGTAGGPPSTPLARFDDWAACPAEPSGLHEVTFTYDDERDYIARALEIEYQALRSGTSVFSHPVVVSVLSDAEGIVRGIRIVTDDRVSPRDRRNAYTLSRNFKARFGAWNLVCEDVPPREGEMPVGNQFVHELCRGAEPGTGRTLMIRATYLRKRGQQALSRETQSVNPGYFESRTFFELLDPPHVAGGAG